MNKIKLWASKLFLWQQTAALFTLVITLVIIIVFTNNYLYNRSSVISSHVSHTEDVLRLEMDTIISYVKELTSFTLQPCFDFRFIRAIESRSSLTDLDIEYIREQMRAYYYTRTDLNSYQIFFMNSSLVIGRDKGAQHITSLNFHDIPPSDVNAFEACDASKYFLAITPSGDSSDFITFYHSLINISNKEALAYVKCDVDRDFINNLVRSYSFSEGEHLLLYNSAGELLFSDTEISTDTAESLFKRTPDTGYMDVTMNGIRYLITCKRDSLYGLTLVSLEPYSVITNNVYRLFRLCLIQGLLLWFASVLVIYYLCRLVMSPLEKLSRRLKKAGEGDFNSRINIGGSLEISELGESYNYMSEHIRSLINENYVVKLNEQSARLIALEAQINPHFLYNTLQAISTEALINDQIQIHEMVISLASILRYSIKGGDFVTIADEMQHVRKYIYLQQIRMGDNLNYSADISNEVSGCIIPKISIQTLVENSIVHGINGSVTSISVSITVYSRDNRVHILVKDNGSGMSPDILDKVRSSFDNNIISPTQTQGLGLANLYGRLKILYDEDSYMTVDSDDGQGTEVHISVPVKRSYDE